MRLGRKVPFIYLLKLLYKISRIGDEEALPAMSYSLEDVLESKAQTRQDL